MEGVEAALGKVRDALGSLDSPAERANGIRLLRETLGSAESRLRSQLIASALPSITAALGQAEIQSSHWLADPALLLLDQEEDLASADLITNALYQTLRDTEDASQPSPSQQLSPTLPLSPLQHPSAAPLAFESVPHEQPSTSSYPPEPASLDHLSPQPILSSSDPAILEPPLLPLPPQGNKKWHSCVDCQTSFAFQRRLFWHRKRHAPLGHTACSLCGLIIRTGRSYSSHLAKAHSRPASIPQTKEYTCFCGFSSRFRQSVHRHAQRTHSLRPPTGFPCPLCDAVLSSASSLRDHSLYRHSPHSVTCSQCPGKRFASGRDLARHSRLVHSALRPFACTKCPKKFKTKQHLSRHSTSMHSS